MSKKIYLIAFMSWSILACHKTSVNLPFDLTRSWTLLSVYDEGKLETPCPSEAENHDDIVITFKGDNDNFNFSGHSVVNSYFGDLEILSYNEQTLLGNIKMGNVGYTEIGGSRELMQCENRYFQIISTAKEIGFDETGFLLLGNFENNGDFLIFSKD